LFVGHFSRKILAIALKGRMLMLKAQSMGSAVAIFTAMLLIACLSGAPTVRAQDNSHEDLSACPGSAPEPTQSASWSVAFCNRTGHDIVIEFHDNDCPAGHWERRGDVYQRTLRRDESKAMPLCYANEPQAKSPPPGVPMVRIPGGKGVVTTWSVVGDCGDRSKPLNLDARSFYDRGDYKTGIILFQHPSGASHCVAEAAGAASGAMAPYGAASGAAGSAANSAARSAPAPGTAVAPPSAGYPSGAGSAQPSPPPVPQPPATPPQESAPSLTAAIDAKDAVARTVYVSANGTGYPGYKCNFTLELQFTDGGSWNDFVKADVTGMEGAAPVSTRKYLKSIYKVALKSTKCTPLK
jgi:hypothetical protein